MKIASKSVALALWLALAAISLPLYAQDQQAEPPPASQAPPETPEQLQQLVAPIALYPDGLVAQILTASTYPTQIVEAERWLQQNQGLQGQQLASAVDQQPWDPSVKALVEFPEVLSNLNRDLTWTSNLGDAYYNQPQDVMNAVQEMRRRAEAAGTLKTTPQEVVTNEGGTIVIAPASPEIVYVPTYDPWLAYGAPLPIYPGWAFGGLWVDRPFFGFNIGIGLGFWGGFGWGWPAWGFDWHHGNVWYHRAPYFSHSPAFFNHRDYYGHFGGPGRPGGVYRGAQGFRGAPGGRFEAPRPVAPNAARGFGAPRGQTGIRSGAFAGVQHGGMTHDFSARGRASFGGGFHGGGGHGGGGRR